MVRVCCNCWLRIDCPIEIDCGVVVIDDLAFDETLGIIDELLSAGPSQQSEPEPEPSTKDVGTQYG